MVAKKRCQYCGKLFVPDRRVHYRQKACSAPCQKLRKQQNNRAFSKNNPGYWCGRYGAVKEWRQEHPEYQKQWRRKRKQQRIEVTHTEIQAEMFVKAIDAIEKHLALLREIQAECMLQVLDTVGQRTFSRPRRCARYKPR